MINEATGGKPKTIAKQDYFIAVVARNSGSDVQLAAGFGKVSDASAAYSRWPMSGRVLRFLEISGDTRPPFTNLRMQMRRHGAPSSLYKPARSPFDGRLPGMAVSESTGAFTKDFSAYSEVVVLHLTCKLDPEIRTRVDTCLSKVQFRNM